MCHILKNITLMSLCPLNAKKQKLQGGRWEGG